MIQHCEGLGSWYEIAQVIPLLFIGAMCIYCGYLLYKNRKNRKDKL
jgi:uncharacterized membrane protein YhdT